MTFVFVGCDHEGDACIYIRYAADEASDGQYLTEAQLRPIADALETLLNIRSKT